MRNFQLPRFSVWQSTSIFFLHQKVFPLSLFFHFPITPWYRLEIFSIWLCNKLILSNFPGAFYFWLESVFTFFFNAGFTPITTCKSILIYLGFHLHATGLQQVYDVFDSDWFTFLIHIHSLLQNLRQTNPAVNEWRHGTEQEVSLTKSLLDVRKLEA